MLSKFWIFIIGVIVIYAIIRGIIQLVKRDINKNLQQSYGSKKSKKYKKNQLRNLEEGW